MYPASYSREEENFLLAYETLKVKPMGGVAICKDVTGSEEPRIAPPAKFTPYATKQEPKPFVRLFA